MSSFKKIGKAAQKTHRERSQPASRKQFGYLEKKKDYKVRARDYHVKQDKLKKLQRKALNRNPDEFYYKMISSRLQDGVHTNIKKKDTVTEEQQLLMDTQDKKYVNFKLTVENKKVEKLRSSLHLVDESVTKPQNKHMFFVDTEQEVEDFNVPSHLETLPADILSTDEAEIVKNEKRKKYRELSQRINRQQQLKVIGEKMTARSLKKDKRKKVLMKQETETSAAVYKFFPVRKR